MIRQILIEELTEIEVCRAPNDEATHIVLMDENGYLLTLVLPDGKILEAVAERLMLYHLWQEDGLPNAEAF